MAMAQKLIELVRSIGNDVKLLTQRVDEAEGGAAEALTEAEAQTGTSAVRRTISAVVLKAAIVYHGLKIGTTATAAKAGNWLPAWGDVGDKPAFIAAGGTQAAARSAIGAGTSNLTLGSTSSTAKAGNWLPSVSDVTGLADALAGKVDKVTGKGLSSEDFTAAYKSKLDGVEAGAQVNPVIVNGLASDDASKVLSAAQGKVLKGLIDNINTLLQSDDSTLDELQEIVDFVKLNRAELDSLGISSIAGLQQALDERVLSTDARLTNSREWTASTVTQAEAEAGTATTARKWTAQRVWQAIAKATAAAAVKLSTARTLTIGSTGKTFDGSANVSWSLPEIGAAAASHSHASADVSDATAIGRALMTAANTAAALVTLDLAPFATDKAGLVPARTGTTTTKFLREDGTWVVPTNTTYSSMIESEVTAGTATTARLITPARLKLAVTTHGLKIGTTGDTAAAGDHTHGASEITGLPDAVVASLPAGTSGQVLKHNGTTWAAGTDNDTTYSTITNAEATAGTSTASRLVTPARLKLAIEAHAVPTATGQALEQRVSQLEASSSSGGITRARAQAIALCF